VTAGIHWNEKRQRWIASVTVGYTSAGKRIVKKASGNTKTAAKNKLKEILRDHDDGLAAKASAGYTVANAVNDWLANYALVGRDPNTITAVRSLVNNHVIPSLRARKLVDLSADDVDAWLAEKAKTIGHVNPTESAVYSPASSHPRAGTRKGEAECGLAL
jgi:hypothetical protein